MDGNFPSGYSYISSNWSEIQAISTYIVLNNNESMPFVTNDGDSHSINQMWWLTTPGGSNQTVSLEAGWINCNYWTSTATTSLFVFSSPDGYQDQNNGAGDQYNTGGGFIQFTNTPALGSPITDVKYKFSYNQYSDESGGYKLTLVPFTKTLKEHMYSILNLLLF